jgi:hypothetical protein
MAAFTTGIVRAVAPARRDMLSLEVDTTEGPLRAFGFGAMLGRVDAGDRVVVNTTGVALGLGTGGVGFALWNLDGEGPAGVGPGHIVKMRYTPWQHNVLAVEEEGSPHHEALTEERSLGGVPVVACGLHSQVAGVAAGIKATAADARVGYLMTDGASLPLAWSDLVHDLVAAGLVDVTCTSGHAFGGDLEAVNEFSGMVALRRAGGADAIVAGLGPGVVGTGTALGYSALEQGQLLDATSSLDGRAVACLRVSFADGRPRHRGVSHHSLTALTVAARAPCTVAVPVLPAAQAERVREQTSGAGLERHRLVERDGAPALALLEERGVRPTSMGRSVEESPELWLAAGAAGVEAAAG